MAKSRLLIALLAAAAFATPTFASDFGETLTQLPSAAPLTGNELLYTVQGGISKQTTVNALGGIVTPIINVNAFPYNASPTASAAANTAAIQAAELACSATGGTLQFGPGVYVVNSLTKYSNCSWNGVGDLITVLLLAPGQNTDLIGTYNAYTLFGTNSNGGVHDFTLSNMTLDGNYGNETAGSCFVDYGYRFKIQHVTMRNCTTYGWRTAYGPLAPPDGSHNMEADIDDVHILKSGGHGIWFAGPHDSVLKNVTVVMASCAANNTSSGIFNDANGGFRGIAIHPWADSGTCPNLPRWALYDTGGGLNITASHFEGAVTGAAYIGGNSSTFDTSNDYYTVTGAPEDIIVVAGSSNQVGGWVNDSYSLGQYGVGVTGSGNNINLVGGAKAGMIDFASDPGGNNYIVTGGTVTADYTGAFPATDNIQLSTYRSGAHNYTQIPGPVTTPGLPTSAGGGGLYICVDSTGTQYKKASCP